MQSQSKASDKHRGPEGAKKSGKPPSAAKANQRGTAGEKGRKAKEDHEDEDTGDTFLTDILTKKRAGSQASNKKRGGIKEEDDEEDSEELQDVVYDYAQTQFLLEEADDFLH